VPVGPWRMRRNPLQRVLVTDMTAEGVTGVRGIRDHPTLPHDFPRHAG